MDAMLDRYYNNRDIAVLKGKTVVSADGLDEGEKCIIFRCSDGTAYKMFHQRDGEEVVYISKIDRIESFVRLPEAALRTPESDEDRAACEDYVSRKLMQKITDALFNSPVTLAERVVFDRELLPSRLDKNRHLDPHGSQKTLFLIATGRGVLSITWTGLSDDPMESTEIDFVQIAGEGVWKEPTA